MVDPSTYTSHLPTDEAQDSVADLMHTSSPSEMYGQASNDFECQEMNMEISSADGDSNNKSENSEHQICTDYEHSEPKQVESEATVEPDEGVELKEKTSKRALRKRSAKSSGLDDSGLLSPLLEKNDKAKKKKRKYTRKAMNVAQATPLVTALSTAENYTTPQMDEVLQKLAINEANKAPQKRRRSQEMASVDEIVKATVSGRRVTRSLMTPQSNKKRQRAMKDSMKMKQNDDAVNEETGEEEMETDCNNNSVVTNFNSINTGKMCTGEPIANKKGRNKNPKKGKAVMVEDTDEDGNMEHPQLNPFGDASQGENAERSSFKKMTATVDKRITSQNKFHHKGDSVKKAETMVEYNSKEFKNLSQSRNKSTSNSETSSASSPDNSPDNLFSDSSSLSLQSGSSSRAPCKLRSLKKVLYKLTQFNIFCVLVGKLYLSYLFYWFVKTS